MALSLVWFVFFGLGIASRCAGGRPPRQGPNAHAQAIDPLLLAPRLDGDANNPPRFGIRRKSDERDASRFRALRGQTGTGAGSTGSADLFQDQLDAPRDLRRLARDQQHGLGLGLDPELRFPFHLQETLVTLFGIRGGHP